MSEQKKPVKNGIFGYRSMSEKSIQATVDKSYALGIASLVICCIAVVLGLVNMLLLKDLKTTGIASDADSWIECTLDNYVGYKVKADWNTTSYDDAVVFQPNDTIAISANSEDIAGINKRSNITLTFDNLRDYIEKDFTSVSNTEGYSVSDVSYEEYPILGTTGYLYHFKQVSPTDNGSASTYTSALFFIYMDYLYTFSYTSASSSYDIPDFDKILASIRVIPEAERPTLVPIENNNSSLVNDYADLGSDIASEINSEADSTEAGSDSDTPSE